MNAQWYDNWQVAASKPAHKLARNLMLVSQLGNFKTAAEIPDDSDDKTLRQSVALLLEFSLDGVREAGRRVAVLMQRNADNLQQFIVEFGWSKEFVLFLDGIGTGRIHIGVLKISNPSIANRVMSLTPADQKRVIENPMTVVRKCHGQFRKEEKRINELKATEVYAIGRNEQEQIAFIQAKLEARQRGRFMFDGNSIVFFENVRMEFSEVLEHIQRETGIDMSEPIEALRLRKSDPRSLQPSIQSNQIKK